MPGLMITVPASDSKGQDGDHEVVGEGCRDGEGKGCRVAKAAGMVRARAAGWQGEGPQM
jgi:hypothetical protein